MRQGRKSDRKIGFLAVFLGLLLLHAIRISMPVSAGALEKGKIFLELRGDLSEPGVYCFSEIPSLAEILDRFGASEGAEALGGDIVFSSGKGVEISKEKGKFRLSLFDMTGYYKTTLGIPISINRESREGLLAVPGIGPRIADSIVAERSRRDGALTLGDLGSLQGIGPRLLGELERYLTQ
ncbi:MAG: hypothetical protein C4582_07000 [Desulfobacteraceae bacterium]|jgi:competence protein ComEA|nr:MAG: hypothetical protein C4582_07000 [Desulfobacteraceae bacterium]